MWNVIARMYESVATCLIAPFFTFFWKTSFEAEPKVGARVKIVTGDLIGEKGRYVGRDPQRRYNVVLDDRTEMYVDRHSFRIILTARRRPLRHI
jgi:hypothetical protein